MKCDFRANEVCTYFCRGLLQRGRRTGVELVTLAIIHIMHHLSDILRRVVIWNNGFPVIQKQMTLKVYKPVGDRFARSYLYATSMFLCLN